MGNLKPFYTVSITVEHLTFEVKWRWETTKIFTITSAYRILYDRGIRCKFHSQLWKAKVPPKVKVLLWVLLQNKLLTRAVLEKKGMSSD